MTYHRGCIWLTHAACLALAVDKDDGRSLPDATGRDQLLDIHLITVDLPARSIIGVASTYVKVGSDGGDLALGAAMLAGRSSDTVVDCGSRKGKQSGETHGWRGDRDLEPENVAVGRKRTERRMIPMDTQKNLERRGVVTG